MGSGFSFSQMRGVNLAIYILKKLDPEAKYGFYRKWKKITIMGLLNRKSIKYVIL